MDRFRWLRDPQEARNGKRLERGAVYPVKDFPEHVVAEWVKTGAAEYVVAEAKSRPRKENE